jgi:hypothetical protein
MVQECVIVERRSLLAAIAGGQGVGVAELAGPATPSCSTVAAAGGFDVLCDLEAAARELLAPAGVHVADTGVPERNPS